MVEIFKNSVRFVRSAVADQHNVEEDLKRIQIAGEIETSKQLALLFGRLAISDYLRIDSPHYVSELLESRRELKLAGLTWMEIGLEEVEIKQIDEIQKQMGIE